MVSRITSAASLSSRSPIDMAELVVHVLQAVHVDEQQGDGGSGPRRDQELVLAEREEAAPVGETGELVHRGEPAELLLELGEVRSGPDERSRERAELVAER